MYLASKHSIFAILEKSENCFEYLSSRMGDTVQSGTSTVDISFLKIPLPFCRRKVDLVLSQQMQPVVHNHNVDLSVIHA